MSKSQQPPGVVRELDEMGFLWDLNLSNDLRWYYHYEELKKYHTRFGHTRVPSRNGEFNALGIWVLRQRRREDVLSAQSKRLLNAIDFEWSSDIQQAKDEYWNGMYNKLKSFYHKYGHSSVPDRYQKDEKLGRWVSTVRYSEMQLGPWKKKLLKKVEFRFRADIRKQKEANRQKLFSKLGQFYNKHGHANVPETYKDSKLAISVAYLRQHPERITPAERKLLKSWNFLFSEEIRANWEQLWIGNFKKLERFKSQYGHCRVSSVFRDQPLARWVASQRIDKKAGKLPTHREKKLRALGFSFYDDIAALKDKKWTDQYKKLIRFKKIYGTTAVPEGYQDKQLAYWVAHQRKGNKKMTSQRRGLLNQIGFVWKMK